MMYGRKGCTACKGDRIMNNLVCECPSGTYDDHVSEYCKSLKTFDKMIFYTSFDGQLYP